MLSKLAEYQGRFLKYCVFGTAGTMTGLIAFQVIARYGFGRGFGWTEEIARYLMIYTAFLGAALAFKSGHFVGMDAITMLLSYQKQRIVKITTYIMLLFLVVLIGKYGIDVIMRIEQLTPGLRIHYKYIYMAIPIGCYFLFVQIRATLVETIKGEAPLQANPFADVMDDVDKDTPFNTNEGG